MTLNKKEKSGHLSLFNSLFSRDVRGAASIRGIYLAGCQLDGLAKKLSNKEWEHNTQSPWFAGYGESVNWMNAAWMDMKFWHILLGDHHWAREKQKKSQSRRMDALSTPYQLLDDGHGAPMWKLGLHIYRQGEEYVDLMSEYYFEEMNEDE